MTMVTDITDDNFDSIVLRGNRKTCVMFWAEWAGPCHLASDTYDELSEKSAEANLVAIDIGENVFTAQQYGIRSVPTFILFEDGESQRSLTGAVAGNVLEAFIND